MLYASHTLNVYFSIAWVPATHLSTRPPHTTMDRNEQIHLDEAWPATLVPGSTPDACPPGVFCRFTHPWLRCVRAVVRFRVEQHRRLWRISNAHSFSSKPETRKNSWVEHEAILLFITFSEQMYNLCLLNATFLLRSLLIASHSHPP
jgi:hypothetical protein